MYPTQSNRPQARDFFDGVLLIDKPQGPTSHDVVDKIRRYFRFEKVGHGGSLDPQATGLLIILIGKGTKISAQFMTADKTYEGCMHLGISTDSHDAEGKVLRESDPSSVTRERLEAGMAAFRGDVFQVPPMVSAVKKNGVPLYKLARKGKTIEREKRLVHIHEFVVTEFSPPLVHFRMRCTKGTYVRTICHDLGEALGCGAHLSQLRRTQCGGFNVADAITVAQAIEMDRTSFMEKIIPLSRIPSSHQA